MHYKDGGPAFPTEKTGQLYGSDGMSLRDYFAAKAGDPPSAFVTAYRESVQMGRIRYTYGNPDNDGSARRHDQELIAEYQAKLRAAWAYTFADAMMEARNVR